MNNSSGKNFLLLLVGFGMLGSGLVLFFRQIELYTVNSTFWGLLGSVGNQNLTGALFIPLILGVVLWVLFTNSIWPKILTWVSVVAIILSVISTLRIAFRRADAFTSIMYLLLIFVGGALVLKKMYLDSPKRKKDKDIDDAE